MIVLAAAIFAAQLPIDISNARQIHTGTVRADGWGYSPDCTDWKKARQKRGRHPAPLEAWVTGVITGYNLYHPKNDKDALDLLEGKKLSDAFAWIDQQCAIRPSAALPDITVDLIYEWRTR